MRRRTLLWGAAVTLAGGVGGWLATRRAAGGAVTVDEIGDRVQTLPRGRLPVFAETADVQALYRYAVEHGDELHYIPCTCGCARFGHRSNRDCYVKAEHPDGTITFTSHAAT